MGLIIFFTFKFLDMKLLPLYQLCEGGACKAEVGVIILLVARRQGRMPREMLALSHER